MRVLIVDNQDSFTFNLAQLIGRAAGCDPLVVPNHERNWSGLIARREIEAVVISPGPGSPERPSDFGTCVDLIREATVPLLGVCLGHQGLAHAYGGRVVRAPVPMHGRVSSVTHDGGPLFERVPSPFHAVRYHSLCIDRESLPACLRVTATADDGVPMAVSHGSRLQFGVQFHPESAVAEFGERMVMNFLRIVAGSVRPSRRQIAVPARTMPGARNCTETESRVVSRTLDRWIHPELVFETLFEGSDYSFWLDSSSVIPGYSRFSIMGDASAPGDEVLLYRTSDHSLQTTCSRRPRTRRVQSLVHELRSRLRRPVLRDSSLPFDFQTGLVGFVGYEMRSEFGAPVTIQSTVPDAAFIDASRCLVFDHAERRVWMVARRGGSDPDPEPWFKRIGLALRKGLVGSDQKAPTRRRDRLVAVLADSPDQYFDKIRDCQAQLAAGESYQVCLSSVFSVECGTPPFDVYRELRARNPAPCAAFLQLGDFALLSSSPERFLQVSPDRVVCAKPIKGTAKRRTDPQADARLATWLRSDEKSRSENLMIVDLLRNDIGRVASTGSVHVPKLMDVESYATVHQLVSTVTGQLRQDLDCLDCLAAAFPGGSMTGAPKSRTMSIINRLEDRARGPYSGALGFLSYGDVMDLSIVIRTIVMEASRATVSSGGGIVALSEPQAEFDEMVLKARAPLQALAASSTGSPEGWILRYAEP